MDLKEAGWEIVDRSNLAADRDTGRLLSTREVGKIWIAEQLLVSEEEPCSFYCLNKILTLYSPLATICTAQCSLYAPPI